MFQNILIATDDSRAVENAINYSAVVFPEATYHLLSVINTTYKSVPLTDIILQDLEKQANHAIDRGKSILLEKGVESITTTVGKGVPSKEIARYIKENDVELLVIARTAKECVPHIGATCLNVLEITHCPILIVPMHCKMVRPHKIFNPTSGSKYSVSVSEMAVLISDHFNAKLFSLYVGKHSGRITLETVEQIARKLGVEFSGREAKKPIDKDIIECAKGNDMAVFSRGYSGIRYKFGKLKKRAVLGTLDRELISEAAIPLLVMGD